MVAISNIDAKVISYVLCIGIEGRTKIIFSRFRGLWFMLVGALVNIRVMYR